MKKIRCMIIDDEPLAQDLLEQYVRQTPFLELTGRCGSATEAMEHLQQQPADLLFLDIQMPGLSGMAFSKTLPPEVKVIFTTAFEQYAIEGFKVEALDYLLKPFDYEEFLQAAVKARNWFERVETTAPAAAAPYIFVKSGYKQVRIDLNDILYFEGLKDYVKIYTAGSNKAVVTLMSLKALEELLPAGQFMRVHRSYIVQLDKIQSVERNQIQIGTAQIPVADAFKASFQQFLNSKTL